LNSQKDFVIDWVQRSLVPLLSSGKFIDDEILW